MSGSNSFRAEPDLREVRSEVDVKNPLISLKIIQTKLPKFMEMTIYIFKRLFICFYFDNKKLSDHTKVSLLSEVQPTFDKSAFINTLEASLTHSSFSVSTKSFRILIYTYLFLSSGSGIIHASH